MVHAAFYKFKWTKIIDLGIAARTLSKYSHCEFVFSDGMCFSSTTRVGPTEGAVQDGTRFTRIDMNPDRWDLIPLSYIDEPRLRTWCENRKDRRYDYAGIVAYLVPFWQADPERDFCSEVLAYGMMDQGVVFKRRPHRISPGKLHTYLSKNQFRILSSFANA